MRIVSFSETVYASFKKSAGQHHVSIDAGKSYVFSTHQISNLIKDHQRLQDRLFKLSHLEPRLTSFNVGARRVGGQRLLLYNGSGGYGDQIMTWPIGKILSDLGFEVHILVDPGNLVCWSNFAWVKSTIVLPVPYEVVKMFDYHALFEVVSNADEHQDQEHTVDIMLRRIGIDPLSIKPEQKVVPPIFTYGENLATTGAFNDKELAIFQLSAALPLRSLTDTRSVWLLQHLAAAYPQYHWLAIHDDFIPKEYAKLAGETGMQNIQTISYPMLRELWAITRRARVVVAPDSMMVHVAGSMGVPCVGLWGSTDPNNRVRYYRNHHAIFEQKACRFAPCNNYMGEWPRYCPQRDTRKECEVLLAVSCDMVVNAIEDLIGVEAINIQDDMQLKATALSSDVDVKSVNYHDSDTGTSADVDVKSVKQGQTGTLPGGTSSSMLVPVTLTESLKQNSHDSDTGDSNKAAITWSPEGDKPIDYPVTISAAKLLASGSIPAVETD